MISVAWRELFAREASKACNACGVLHLRCCHKAQIQSALIGKSCHDERTGNRGGSKHPKCKKTLMQSGAASGTKGPFHQSTDICMRLVTYCGITPGHRHLSQGRLPMERMLAEAQHPAQAPNRCTGTCLCSWGRRRSTCPGPSRP